MTWVFLALFTAFLTALKDGLNKIAMNHGVSEFMVAWIMQIIACPIFLVMLFWIDWPEIDQYFWIALCTGALINLFNTIVFMKAIRLSDLSVTVPLTTLTPLFLLFTSPVMVGEYFSMSGAGGIILIAAGAYLLNVKHYRHGIFTPFKMLFSEKGPRYVFLVTFLWSITANIDKIGLLHSSALFWCSAGQVFFTILMTIAMVCHRALKNHNNGNGLFSIHQNINGMLLTVLHNKMSLFMAGLCWSANLLLHMIGLTYAIVPYFIGVKRTSAIFAVMFGYFFFKEKDFRSRLLGATIMAAGAIIISLYG